MTSAARRVREKRDLRAFLKAMRQKDCVVCNALPDAIKRQIRFRPQKVNITTIVAWLREQGYAITVAQYTAHARAMHEPPGARSHRVGTR